ncbi:MAG: zinc-binding dehydrogenase [Alphaproteobacteria bacterium]|nr:zinc-binding dehydrogenase [Alphaproteobacteria bacterium]
MATDTDMIAVVADETAAGQLRLQRVLRPVPKPFEALIRVGAVSLNRGEVKTALTAPRGFRPGWDFAGVVEAPAADGSGPVAGARVVGLAPSAAWGEYVVALVPALAEIPQGVTLADAAALPVAGLTARAALAIGPPLPGQKVLITGASGGVGVFAIQLAAVQRADITAAIRNPANESLVRSLGANQVAVGEGLDGAAPYGPFDLILESVGGTALATALGLLAPGATCVVYGASQSAITTFDASRFRIGGTSLYGLVMQYELARTPPSIGLAELLALNRQKRLVSVIGVRAPLADIARIAGDLIARRFAGKAVLIVDPTLA